MFVIVLLFTLLFKGSLERNQLLDRSHVQSKLEKLDMLEKEYSRLTTMQSIAEVCPLYGILYQIYLVHDNWHLIAL